MKSLNFTLCSKIMLFSGALLIVCQTLDYVICQIQYANPLQFINLINAYKPLLVFEYLTKMFINFIFLSFSIPVLLKKAKYVYVLPGLCASLICGLIGFLFSDWLSLSFTPDDFRFSVYTTFIIVSLALLVSYTQFLIHGNNRFTRVGSILLLICEGMNFLSLILWGIMFSIDNSYFTERFSDIISIFSIFNKYISGILYLTGIVFFFYSRRQIIKKETN